MPVLGQSGVSQHPTRGLAIGISVSRGGRRFHRRIGSDISEEGFSKSGRCSGVSICFGLLVLKKDNIKLPLVRLPGGSVVRNNISFSKGGSLARAEGVALRKRRKASDLENVLLKGKNPLR